VPIYEYRCDDCGASFEVMQKMSDEPLRACERCGGDLHKVLHPVAIHFKGSGFYTTDYGRGSGRAASTREGGDGEGSSQTPAADDAKTTKPKPEKTDAKGNGKGTGKESKAAT
jgi:putative FmdB family regulatory protein